MVEINSELPDRNLALELVRTTEAAALAAARWMGRGDKEGADGAAVDAMRIILGSVPMDGLVIIGEGEKDEAPNFFGASLDHAVWFHQKSNPYDWQFHHHVGVTHMGNRGLATGAIYSKSGMHLATVTQEILQRF